MPAPDPFFELKEKLFRRFQKSDFDESGKVYPLSINFRNWSVNRSKYSDPKDVLKPNWLKWGVGSFKVQDIPQNLTSPSGSNNFQFIIKHVPLDTNYAHSEIRTYKNGQYVSDPDPPSVVKKAFRTKLSEKIVLLITPQV